MYVSLTKLDHNHHRVRVVRDSGIAGEIVLETAVFFLHDLTHFVVEQLLGYRRGFWGMLAAGHSLAELGGKANPLTEQLRFIEKIVGPVQSAYMGHFEASFIPMAIAHLDFPLPDRFAERALEGITELERCWNELLFGKTLELEWSIL
jgi:hypothetical protein